MIRHDASHEFDPAIAAQAGLSRNQTWKPKVRNDNALRAVTRTWAEQLARAWNRGRPVTVISANVGVGASAAGIGDAPDRIWLDDKVLLPRSARDLAAAVGIVSHELGHLFHTPKTTDRFTSELQSRGLWNTFNMIEDGKQEMKLLAARPGFEKYLKHAVLKHLLMTMNPMTIGDGYLLIAGRTYLPQSLRDRMRVFSVQTYGADAIDEFDRLLREFFRVDPLVQVEEAIDVVQAIHDLFPSNNGGCGTRPTDGDTQEPTEGWNPFDKEDDGKKDSESDEDPTGGANSEDEHDEEKDNSKAGGGEEGDEPAEGDEGAESDKGDEAQGSGAKDKDKATAKDGAGEDDEGEEWDPMEGFTKAEESKESEGEGEAEDSGKHAGAGGAEQPGEEGPSGPSEEEIKQAMDRIRDLSEVITDSLVEDFEEDFELIKSEAFGDGNVRRPEIHEIDMQREMVTALKQMQEQAKGGLDRRRPKGRLNVGRYIRNKDRQDVERITFDKFRPNAADALDMEVVVTADNSGSISGSEYKMAGVLWALTTALESVGGPNVTVILWNSDFRIIKVPTEKWKVKYVPTVDSMGGTDPHGMLEYCRKLFKESRKKQKLLFILTDGAWYNMEAAREVTLKMKAESSADTYIIGFNGFNVENLELYGATDGSSGGLEAAGQFIFKVAEDRMKAGLINRR